MYTAFYGLTTYPFTLTPDPRFLYRSQNHEKCLRYLSYSLERGYGLIVFTGQIGTGKTLLLNTLVQGCDAKTHIAFLPHAKLEFLDLLLYIFQELNLASPGKSKAELLIALKSFLLACEKSNEKVVIIIDEAQNLSIDTLEELRLLTNFDHDGKKLLQIIFVGQPQLAHTLQLPELTQFRQRIGFNCQLLPLDYRETKGYIEKRLAVAGSTDRIFTTRAIKKIFVYSQGIPRVINLICDTALLFGFGEEKRTIGRTIIQQVMKELNLYVPDQSLRQDTNAKRDAQGAHARGITAPRDPMLPDFPAPSRSLEGMGQGEPHPSQRGSRRPYRRTLIAGLASLSLLGVGVVLHTSLTGRKLREYTASSVPHPQPLVPQPSGMSAPPLLPPLSDVSALPKRMQWVQTTLSYRLPTGKPLRVSLRQLQRTPESLPVKVTLEAADRTPRWLQFDPDTLTLSGTAPRQDRGKTYHLTFRAHTADGLESLLHLVIHLEAQPRR